MTQERDGERPSSSIPPRLELVEIAPPPGSISVEEFVDSLYARTPRAYVTWLLIFVNVAIFAAMAATGVHPLQPVLADLIRWGANFGPLTSNGEWYRLLAATFLHAGVVHLAFNVLALAQGGAIVERLLGHAAFAATYFACGLIASLASLWWHPFGASVGASGAVFGVFGALLGCYLKARSVIPARLFRGTILSLLPFLAYNLIYGMLAKNVDQSAHVAGFLAGFGLGFMLGLPRIVLNAQGRGRRTALVLAVVVPLIAASIYGLRGYAIDPAPRLHHLAQVRMDARKRFNKSLTERMTNKITDRDLAAMIEAEILPDLRGAVEALEGLRHLPPSVQAQVNAALEQARIELEIWELRTSLGRTEDPAEAEKVKERLKVAEKRLLEATLMGARAVRQQQSAPRP